jgi:hypothetical protein
MRPEHDTEVVIRELLDVVEPRAEGLARARQMFGLDAQIVVAVEMHGHSDDGRGDVGTPALSLTAETLHRLAQLDVSLDIDQYIAARPYDTQS